MMEFSTATKKTKLLIHAAAWKDLSDMMLSGRGQTQKSTYYDSIYTKSRNGRQ